jgi:hypothetical protein
VVSMNLAELIEQETDKKSVFAVINNLTCYYPEVGLKYREGRRSDDPFSKNIEPVNQALFQKIRYSNGWQVHLSDIYGHTLSFYLKFKSDAIAELEEHIAQIHLPKKLSTTQLYYIRQCQQIKRDIRHLILLPLQEEALSKSSAAFKTTFCVVGKDMMRAIALIEEQLNVLKIYRFESIEAYIKQVEKNTRSEASTFIDSEGFIIGTLITIFERINQELLPANDHGGRYFDNKFQKVSR